MTYQIKREQRIALAIAEQFCRQWDLLPKVKRNHFRFANAGEPTLLTENCIVYRPLSQNHNLFFPWNQLR